MLCSGAEESSFNINLLLSKRKSFTWISLVQDCQALFIILATNHFCSSTNLHDIMENTTRQILWPGIRTNLKLKTKYKVIMQGKEDKMTGGLLGYYLKENK